MTLTLSHYLVLGGLLFSIGLFGALTRRNAIAVLISIEIMLLAVALNFTACTQFLGDPAGQIFSIFIITIAAAEASVALALVITIYRLQKGVDLDQLTILKG